MELGTDLHGEPLPPYPPGGMSEALADAMVRGWAAPPTPGDAEPVAAWTAARREAVSAAFPGEVLVTPSGAAKVRSNDDDFPFRPASDHVWLTGAQDPHGVLVLEPAGDRHEAVLYAPRRSDRTTLDFVADRVAGELWVGWRRGVDGTAAALQVRCRPLDELGAALDALADGRPVRLLRGVDPWVDARLPDAEDPDGALGRTLAELRLRKDPFEVAALRAAVASTARGFDDVVAELRRAGRDGGERWLEGTFLRRARAEGEGAGYLGIVGAGGNATILHREAGRAPVRHGELLLCDLGVEGHERYTADITRTVPVAGRWTSTQRDVYEAVLAAQAAGIAAVRAGAAFQDPHRAAQRVLAEALHSWGVLPVPAERSLEPDCLVHRRWTLHGTSHHLGLDVHDCAAAREERNRTGTLEAGHVITVEPGLYFQPDDLTVPEELRGLGVRIEDDVLVTADGGEVLSAAIPREPDDVAAWVAG